MINQEIISLFNSLDCRPILPKEQMWHIGTNSETVVISYTPVHEYVLLTSYKLRRFKCPFELLEHVVDMFPEVGSKLAKLGSVDR